LIESLAPVLGFSRREAQLLQDAPGHLANDGAVIHHQAVFHAFLPPLAVIFDGD